MISGHDNAAAFVGDVHLDRDDPLLKDFVAFLQRLGRRCDRIVLMGDLFNLWIGRREMEQEHQAAVVSVLSALRAGGTRVDYLEGNRDYRIGGAYRGAAFDSVAEESVIDRCGGHSILAAHGDLVNPDDRQYRLWRRVSRSGPVWGLFHLLPRAARLRVAATLETRFRTTNPGFRGGFPEDAVRRFAARAFERGHDTVVLGHFHVEKDLHDERGSGRILVLPDWKGSRRHLEVAADGAMGFVDSAA